ncbi:hypothetical protein NIES267_21870 [Calothrix parasitica NIES-267]|uniref:DUF2157 domain-containing protein n=1 Tax=Calothrix parasitica NIES-267 TaxID=1973488 RepID=A0A1Z4LNA8_9CYAN|nr:hypothetical protein NIES267_21870 [Calothrix parasitica NIES-267]
MSSNSRPVKFEIALPSEHPHLLEGLDEWLRLGLISDSQVRQFCWEYLTCRVILQTEVTSVKPTKTPFLQPRKPAEKAKATATPSLFGTIWQSFRAEFSVRWLLFLGMFTVVISSGALAGSQWERFTAVLQYGVLFAYTLLFFGLSFWTSKQANLRLTSGALHIVTMLLVPINFWAMDSFGLWQNPLNLIFVAIASIVLTRITVLLSKQSIFTGSVPVSKLSFINILGLSFLHFGWKINGFPLIAVYLALIGTTVITVFQNLRAADKEREESEFVSKNKSQFSWGKNLPATVIVYSSILLLLRAIFGVGINVAQLGLAIGICGWLIAWLAQREDRKTRRQGDKGTRGQGKISPSLPKLFSQSIGGFLLFIGWFVTVWSSPFQAITVSGLGLHFFYNRLNLYSFKKDLTTFFAIGLQSMFLGWRLLPYEFQSSIITFAVRLTNYQNNYFVIENWGLLSVGLFPYIIFMVGFTNHLRKTQQKFKVVEASSLSPEKSNEQDNFKPGQQSNSKSSEQDPLTTKNKLDLASFGEILTLILGITLTTISLENPTLRSINLLLSTITLAIVTYQKFKQILSTPSSDSLLPLTYLTHTTAILTLFSWIHLFFPTISQPVWAVICLVVMVGEWLFSVSDGVWQRSSWHIGLVLASLSYLLLLMDFEFTGNNVFINQPSLMNQSSWGLTWLVTPITLTIIGSRNKEAGKNKQIISVSAIILAQLLTLPLSTVSLISLAVGTVTMFVNTRYLRNKQSAIITVGFGLSFIAAGVWEFTSLSYAGWFVLFAVTTLCLWVIRKLLQRGNELANIYAVATDSWGSTICGFELLLLSIHAISIYWFGESDILLCAISAVITLVALAFRHFYESTNWTFYGIGWSVELLQLYLIEIFEFGIYEVTNDGSPQLIYLAIANIGLGLITQFIGEWLQSKHYSENLLPNRWHILPLLYAGFGVLLRYNTFDSWTGLSTLAVAWIVISIGKRNKKLKPLLYLGLFGVSIAAYELLFYQLQQAAGSGTVGDGWIIFATLATGIAYAYRFLSPWLTSYLKVSFQELKMFAHFHWGLGSVLLAATLRSPVTAYQLALATGLLLSCYAIFEGKQANHSDLSLSEASSRIITEADIWVYIGLIQIACFRYFIPPASVVSVFLQQIRPWIAGVSCIFGYLLYILPWQRWGWLKRPWQIVAYILPLFYLWETRIQIYSISLLLVAGYYILIAKIAHKFRFTYISLMLVNWVLWRWYIDLNLTDALWYISSVSLSLLYIAQFDSLLKLPQNKIYRHGLRMLATVMICGYATVFYQNVFWIPGILSLLAIFVGLGLKIRAFLYVGTISFLITAFYHLVIFTFDYPFIKWVVGLLVGITLIFIAANFEGRRQQLNILIRNINTEFKEWE